MKIGISYGQEIINVEVPDENVAGVVYPNEVEIGDETETLVKAIENPINSRSFEEFLSDARDVLFIVNDGTRPTPTAKVLEIIYGRIKERNIKFITATGVHRGPTEEEFRFIFGKYYEEFQDRIYVHDSRKDEDMVYIGTSKNGTEVRLNKLAVEAERLIPISSVEPHYYAGYTGGRKSFLPGIAAYKTIEQNHKHAMSPNAKTLALEGNPVHEDMIDALKPIEAKEIFSIQTVLTTKRKIYAAMAGNIHSSFYNAVEKAKEVFCVRLRDKADIVVTVVLYPKDVDLYQAQNAIENGKIVLKDNGILIVISKCSNGIGPGAFFELLSSCKTPQEALDRVDKGYRLGYHKVFRLAEIMSWAEIWGVTDLPDSDLESIFVKPFYSIQEAIDKAIEIKGGDAKILFLMDGSITAPMI